MGPQPDAAPSPSGGTDLPHPEVAADAIVWASRRARREVWVGLSTVKAILGNRLISGFLDRYLALKACDGQMTGELATEREGNLFEPVSGDFGTRTLRPKRTPLKPPAMGVDLRRSRRRSRNRGGRRPRVSVLA